MHQPTFIHLPCCPICGGDGTDVGAISTYVRQWCMAVESRFRHCHLCDFVWMENPPSAESLLKYYEDSDHYRRATFTDEEAAHIRAQASFLRPRPGNHLEIGADNGAFLDIIRQSTSGGFYFIEINPIAAAGLEAQGLRLASEYKGTYETITLRHVYEHVLDPIGFLRGLKNILGQNGSIFIEVPDYSNISDGVSDRFQLEHLSYFTITSLHRVAQRSGLRIERLEFARTLGYSTTPNRVMRACLTHAGGSEPHTASDWRALIDQEARLQRGFANALHKHAGQRIALYGAGAVTMSLLATAPLDARVDAIFDADPKKHGRRLLGAEVCDPALVDVSKFDLLVLTVVGYEAEVRRFLKAKHIPEKKIMTLASFAEISE